MHRKLAGIKQLTNEVSLKVLCTHGSKYLRKAASVQMKQLMAGGGVALIGTTLVPLLSGLFG